MSRRGMGVITPAVTKRDLEKNQKNYYPAGRKCANPGCITILNRYNSGHLCLRCREEQRVKEEIISNLFEELGWSKRAEE